MSARKIVFIGAADEICCVAIERFAAAARDAEMVLADARPELLDPLVRRLPSRRATARGLDLGDADALRTLVDGAALVILGAGPYARTSPSVIEACLDAAVPYLDINDDVDSTRAALGHDARAKQAGVPLYIGCGASPGATNVFTVDAARDLDTVENIDVCWAVGDERPGIDRTVLEHLLDLATDDFPTWDEGAFVTHQPFVETDRVAISGSGRDTVVYETAHPETVTLPRRFPHAKRIRSLGSLDPAPFNGLARGLGLAVREGRMTFEAAVGFLEDLLSNKLGSVSGWRAALTGMRAQIQREETTTGNVLKFLGLSALRRTYDYRGGLLTAVHGAKDGEPATSLRRTRITVGSSATWHDLAAVTGASTAAFILLALDDTGRRAGAFAPEDWAEPDAFYESLVLVGVPRVEIVEKIGPQPAGPA